MKSTFQNKYIMPVRSIVYLLVLLPLTWISCTKEEVSEEMRENSSDSDGLFSMFNSSPNASGIIYNQGFVSNGRISHFTSRASFKNGNGQPESGVGLYMESIKIDPVSPSSGSHYSTFGNGESYYDKIHATLGDSISIKTSGYSLGDIDQDFYYPMKADLDSIPGQVNLDRDDDLVLTWQTDPNSANNKMGLILLYRGYSSHQLDPTNSTTAQHQIIRQDVVDDGKLTISSSELKSKFPKNAYVDCYFIRGSGRNVSLGSESVDVINFTFELNPLIFRK